MKNTHKIAMGIIAGASLVLGASVLHAETGPMDGMGRMGRMGGMGHGMMGGMGGGMGPGMMGGGMGPGMMGMMGGMQGQQGSAAQQLMTPAERQALQEKMRNAKTPEERQKLAEANRAEMQKRAKEKGITLPERSGPHAGHGMMYQEAPPTGPAR